MNPSKVYNGKPDMVIEAPNNKPLLEPVPFNSGKISS
jgi:hypothetical protein